MLKVNTSTIFLNVCSCIFLYVSHKTVDFKIYTLNSFNAVKTKF